MMKTTCLVLVNYEHGACTVQRMVSQLGPMSVKTSWERVKTRPNGLHNYTPLQGEQGCFNQHGSGEVKGRIVMFGMVVGKV